MEVDHGHCYYIYHVLWKQSFQSMTGHLSYTGCALLDVQRPSHWCQLDIDRACERLVKFLTRESFAIGVTGLGSVGGKLVDSWVLKWRQFKHVESTWIWPRGFHVLKSTWRRVKKFHLNSMWFPRGHSTWIPHEFHLNCPLGIHTWSNCSVFSYTGKFSLLHSTDI